MVTAEKNHFDPGGCQCGCQRRASGGHVRWKCFKVLEPPSGLEPETC